MTQDEPATIGPSIPNLVALFVLGNLVMVAGLLAIYVGGANDGGGSRFARRIP